MLLGIDGGGTKTDALLTDNEGNVLFRRIGGGSNLNDSGLGAVEEHLRALFADLPAGPIDAVYAGVAGGATSDNSQILGQCLRELLPQAKCIEVTSDMPNAYYTVDGVRDGICVVAGTGASGGALVGGKLRQVGGWGHLIDDAGSGFDVGRAVLRAVLRAHDGRGPQTALTPLVEKQLGMPAQDAIGMLYREGRHKIASFAPLAFAAMEEDEVARGIVETAAEELCALIRAAARHLSAPPYFTVLCGGLWKAQPLYARVKALLGADYDLRLPTLPPVCGCAAAAGQKIGLSILPKLKEAHFA